MTKRIEHTVSIDLDDDHPETFQLRLTSGESVTFKRGLPDRESYDLALTEAECVQLEGEGYSIKPGSKAYRPKVKAKKPKKFGGAVKDIAASRNQEEST